MRRDPSGLRLLVGGSSFDTWLSAELDADIFTEADAWNVRASAPSSDLVDFFREGQRMEMYLGDDRQLAGVIDEVKISGNRQRETLALSGRDLGPTIDEGDDGKGWEINLCSGDGLRSSRMLQDTGMSPADAQALAAALHSVLVTTGAASVSP